MEGITPESRDTRVLDESLFIDCILMHRGRVVLRSRVLTIIIICLLLSMIDFSCEVETRWWQAILGSGGECKRFPILFTGLEVELGAFMVFSHVAAELMCLGLAGSLIGLRFSVKEAIKELSGRSSWASTRALLCATLTLDGRPRRTAIPFRLMATEHVLAIALTVIATCFHLCYIVPALSDNFGLTWLLLVLCLMTLGSAAIPSLKAVEYVCELVELEDLTYAASENSTTRKPESGA